MRSILLLALFAAVPVAAAAQPAAVQTEVEALAQDAGDYARRHGVSADEALRRLRAQADSVAETDEIRRTHGARLAGIAFEHGADFHINVLLTGEEPVPDRLIRAGGLDLPIRFRTGARATGNRVIAAIDRHRENIREIINHSGLGLDQRTGELVVVADLGGLGGRDAAEVRDRIAELTDLPVRVRVLDAPSADLGIAGGRRVEGTGAEDGRRYFCTTGFVVTDGARTGIVTAAHCPDSLSYTDAAGAQVPLEFAGGWGAQFQDVQVHVGAGDQPPVFRAATLDRPQRGRRLRSRTRGGETVCHRGEASGYSCAEVELTDFAPPGELCGGPCHPTWVTVAGPGCRGGDSGGPVFLGTTAFGIVKGGNYARDGRCNFYFYMSTDYLPPGWSLVIAGADAAVRPD